MLRGNTVEAARIGGYLRKCFARHHQVPPGRGVAGFQADARHIAYPRMLVVTTSKEGAPMDVQRGEGRGNSGLDKVLVRNILEHADSFDWVMQDIGLLGLRLDEQREYRLHVWAPTHCIGVPVIHDHPYDFVSWIVAGELTNVRYEEDLSGAKYLRERYRPPNEDLRTSDFVQLVSNAETYREGDAYTQLAHELHDSRQLPGTVTIIRRTFRDVSELTVCRPEDAPWISGVSRPATPVEITAITSQALAWF